MNASVDGRILGSRWRPAENRMPGLFERLHEQLGGGSWLIGRVTGSEYAKAASYPRSHRPDLSAGALVRPARCHRLRHRARCAGQDRLGTVRHRRRPDRRGADGAGLRRASGGPPPRWRLLLLRRRARARSGIGTGDPEPRAGPRTPVARRWRVVAGSHHVGRARFFRARRPPRRTTLRSPAAITQAGAR